MRAFATPVGQGFFRSIIVTRANGEVERYDPVRGDMMDMDACRALAQCRADLITQSPHLRGVFYPGEG